MRNVSSASTVVAIAYSLPVSAWWMLQLPGVTAITPGDALHASVVALQTTLVLQLLAVCLFAQQWAKSESETLPTILLVLMPAWPLLAMLGFSTGTPLFGLVLFQAGVLTVGMMILAGSRVITRLFRNRTGAEPLCFGVGIVAAAFVWSFRAEFVAWIGA